MRRLNGYLCGIFVVSAFCAVVLLIGCSSSSAHQEGSQGDLEDGRLVVVDDVAHNGPQLFSNKLAGSTETTDENGVVHGVTPQGIAYTVHGRGEAGLNSDRVSLAAVGDQIASDDALALADRYGGQRGDGVYDFSPWYQEVGPFLRQSDLRFINQETVIASGEGGFAIDGYPSFNSPEAVAEVIASEGFNLVGFATNHSYDKGARGIELSHEVWARYPQLLVGGSYLTQEDRETVHMIERNGLTIAFLNYTYGDNNFASSASMPNTYYSCQFDEALVTADVQRAQQVADAVVVAVHWGTEYTTVVNSTQRKWAEFLADLDVDLVLGAHAHCMQPVEYVEGSSGNKVPVVFGLSDFVSGWTITDTILSTVFTCDFVPHDDGTVTVENLLWNPAIEWSDGGSVRVRLLANMTDAEINANRRTPDVANDADYLRDMVHRTIVEIPSAW